MSLTGTFGATKATELASLFTAADMRVSATLDTTGVTGAENESNFSNEGQVLGAPNM